MSRLEIPTWQIQRSRKIRLKIDTMHKMQTSQIMKVWNHQNFKH